MIKNKFIKKRKLNETLKLLALAIPFFMNSGCASLQLSYNAKPLEQIVSIENKNQSKQEKGLNRQDAEKQIQKDVAVLLIDMQDSFLNTISLDEKKREMPYQLEVLDYCKKNKIPVFVLEYEGYGKTTDILKNKLESLEDKTYITKPHENSFIGTDLAERLNKKGVKTVLLMGINASACVLRTAEGAINKGYTIMTSRDIIADRPPSNHWQFYWDYDESVEWYKKNGIYSDNYQDLLKLISDRSIKE